MAAVRAWKPPRALQPSAQGAALGGVQVGMVYGRALVYRQGHEPADVHPCESISRDRGRLEEES